MSAAQSPPSPWGRTRWTPAQAPDLAGRTALVTGANSGIGFWTAVGLAQRGARVLLACRDAGRAAAALDRARSLAPGASYEVVPLDLSSLASVRAAAADVAGRTAALDVLVNNAGIMAVPRRVTEDGFESQLATNHLGHVALTSALLPQLLTAPAPRVVCVSSYVHRIGRIALDDLQSERSYGRWRAYAQSKLANLLYAAELSRRAVDADSPLVVASAHPGYSATHLQAAPGLRGRVMAIGNAVLAQSDAAGALPSLYAATMPDVVADDFFGPAHVAETRGTPTRVGRAASARDLGTAAALWDATEALVGADHAALA